MDKTFRYVWKYSNTKLFPGENENLSTVMQKNSTENPDRPTLMYKSF